ncbi:MAG: right-handed parallel beta-helix repeat-containing protein [Pseudomonadota bacterium]|nr:right-handed parallel beta-helix repeat-containing protein [Pseudomonadota bacterium]
MLFLIACMTPSLPDVAPHRKPGAAPHNATARRFHTLNVDCAGGETYTTIRDALDDATSGDVISVAPCTYEGFSFGGKSVTIQSTGGPSVTTILATPGKPAIKVKHGEGAGTVLEGFTITGGGAEDEPGIEVQFSALILRDSIVTGNSGTVTLYSYYGHVILDGTTFEDNTPSEGMVIQERRGMTVVKDSIVRCGSATIGYMTEHGGAFADGSTFDCPGATGVEVYHSDGRIQRSVIDGLLVVENENLENERAVVEDSVLLGGADLQFVGVSLRNIVSTGTIAMTDGELTLEGGILTGATCGLSATNSAVTVRSSNFWNNGADTCGMASPVGTDGTISADPRFTDSAARDFRLDAGSPCIDTGPVGTHYADPDGSLNDMGAYGGPLSLGGGW